MLLFARDQEMRLKGKLEGLKEAQLTSNIASAEVLAAAGTDFELIKKACPLLTDEQISEMMNRE